MAARSCGATLLQALQPAALAVGKHQPASGAPLSLRHPLPPHVGVMHMRFLPLLLACCGRASHGVQALSSVAFARPGGLTRWHCSGTRSRPTPTSTSPSMSATCTNLTGMCCAGYSLSRGRAHAKLPARRPAEGMPRCRAASLAGWHLWHASSACILACHDASVARPQQNKRVSIKLVSNGLAGGRQKDAACARGGGARCCVRRGAAASSRCLFGLPAHLRSTWTRSSTPR